jgi:hypothetical protein
LASARLSALFFGSWLRLARRADELLRRSQSDELSDCNVVVGDDEDSRPLSCDVERARSDATRSVFSPVSVGDSARPTLRGDAFWVRADSTRRAALSNSLADQGISSRSSISSQRSPTSWNPLGESSDEADEGEAEFAPLVGSHTSGKANAGTAPTDDDRS